MRQNIRVALETLGCKLNQAETEQLARQFTEAGCIIVSPHVAADVYILNTCTVTHVADRKARHLLRMARRLNPDALVIAAGCYAERAPDELAKLDGIDLVVGNEQKPELPGIIKERLAMTAPASRALTGFRTRSFIKAQDGCNSFCAYCIVPLVRGRERSLPADEVISRVKQRVSEGYKEVVLTGTEIGAFNDNGINLAGLLKRILAETGIARLRLSSIQPQEVTPGLISLWSDDRLCRHFHLSLQSGCDSVLRRMDRHYLVHEYEQASGMIRSLVPDVAITTDIIVGFPGETNDEFETSYEFCRQMEFAKIHVFQYSKRQGTKAALMPGQVPAPVKKHRSETMLELAEESNENFRLLFTGKTMTVLFEQQTGDFWSGFTDNYIKLYVRSRDDLANKLLPVKVIEVEGDGVFGEISPNDQ